MIGLLEISGVVNNVISPGLNQHKRMVEAKLRQDYAGFSRKEFLGLPVMAAYEKYYKRFDKTYHVLLQLESIVIKGRNLPDVSPLVDANFTAEVNTLVLTAGDDVRQLEEPVVIDVSCPGEMMTLMNGDTKPIRAGDMIMRDRHGICCSIIYGQDNLSPITAETSSVLYVSYVPPGVPIEAVKAQLNQIKQNILLFAPQARVEQQRLLTA
jgi:DNA/RNA-binding domain of Phe-tRNA-synthetase-like protein